MSTIKTDLQTAKARQLQHTQVRQYLFPSRNEGFTLIELLVVLVITGVLATISFPALINQIGKSRETEAKIQLGAISRAQEAYHFERQTFAASLAQLTLAGSFTSKYYNFPEPNMADDQKVKHQAIAREPITDRTRDYASGIYFDTGNYEVILCQAKEVGDGVEAPDQSTDPCTNDGVRVQ